MHQGCQTQVGSAHAGSTSRALVAPRGAPAVDAGGLPPWSLGQRAPAGTGSGRWPGCVGGPPPGTTATAPRLSVLEGFAGRLCSSGPSPSTPLTTPPWEMLMMKRWSVGVARAASYEPRREVGTACSLAQSPGRTVAAASHRPTHRPLARALSSRSLTGWSRAGLLV